MFKSRRKATKDLPRATDSHLPECIYSGAPGLVYGALINEEVACVCPALRACEERVWKKVADEIVPTWSAEVESTKRWSRNLALTEAREAVIHSAPASEYSQSLSKAVAAIDALRSH